MYVTHHTCNLPYLSVSVYAYDQDKIYPLNYRFLCLLVICTIFNNTRFKAFALYHIYAELYNYGIFTVYKYMG